MEQKETKLLKVFETARQRKQWKKDRFLVAAGLVVMVAFLVHYTHWLHITSTAMAGNQPAALVSQAGPPTPGPKPSKARRVMKNLNKHSCKAVEYTWKELVKVRGFPYPVIAYRKNGQCLSYAVIRGSCEVRPWPGNDPDPALRNRWYLVCDTRLSWKVLDGKSPKGPPGPCWEELGRPLNGTIITASRHIEVGYDSRGALRHFVDPWGRCRAS
jgi:hypothetical protein